MNINNVIKEEYNNIIQESIEYNNIDFNKINNIQDLTAEVNENILNKLISLSRLIVNLPQEKRLDLTSVKEIIIFLENINKDINIVSKLYRKFEDDENIDEDSLDKLDNTLFSITMIYDELNRLFDNLDSITISIDDKFDEFINKIRKYIR
jgi:hypothetical protein